MLTAAKDHPIHREGNVKVKDFPSQKRPALKSRTFLFNENRRSLGVDEIKDVTDPRMQAAFPGRAPD
jgi:hypothetical protein